MHDISQYFLSCSRGHEMGAQKQSCYKMYACGHDAHVAFFFCLLFFFRAARMPKAHEHHLKASLHLGPAPKCSYFAWSLWHMVPIATCRNGNRAGSGRVAPIPTPPHLFKTIFIHVSSRPTPFNFFFLILICF